MSTDENKALVVGYIDEGWNKQRLAVFDELFDPDLVNHNMPPGLPHTREGTKQLATLCWIAFPELHLTIADQMAEGDKVVTRWTARGTHTGPLMEMSPTGKRLVITGISIDRIVGGKIVETWTEIDQLGILQQLGAISAPKRRLRMRRGGPTGAMGAPLGGTFP